MSAVTFILPHRVGFYLPAHNTRLSKYRRSRSGSICKPAGGFPVWSCRVTGGSTDDYGLYELLGVDPDSDQSAIREAYRSLQKRCHPDIAGPAGHDMAIILNQAYSLLSDPASRLLYDQEQAKMDEFRGYTGKPIYSNWMGSEKEDRAVFVDEIKCVGCLKCALLASQTFGIESVYGRARAVAQWADPPHIIEAAIQACPVDCISVVKRSDLAALEFLMLKQPRGNVRVGAGNTAGARVANVFVDVNKFQRRFKEMKEKTSKPEPQQFNPQREARMAAAQAIMSVSAWLRWHPFRYPTNKKWSIIQKSQVPTARISSRPTGTERLRAAAARRRAGKDLGGASFKNQTLSNDDEYWTPMHILAAPTQSYESTQIYKPSKSEAETSKLKNHEDKDEVEREVIKSDHTDRRSGQIPFALAGMAAIMTGLSGDKGTAGLKEHVAGPIALEIVNSSWLQVLLAASAWFSIGLLMMTLSSMLRKHPPRPE